MTPSWIVLHCSDSDAPAGIDWSSTSTGRMRRYHRSLGWSDVGYHYVVTADGRVHVGRRPDRAGAHARGLNHDAIGVCLVGRFEDSLPPGRQWLAGLDLLASLCAAYDLAADRVIGHREAGAVTGTPVAKTCPGSAIDMGSVRVEVARRIPAMTLGES